MPELSTRSVNWGKAAWSGLKVSQEEDVLRGVSRYSFFNACFSLLLINFRGRFLVVIGTISSASTLYGAWFQTFAHLFLTRSVCLTHHLSHSHPIPGTIFIHYRRHPRPTHSEQCQQDVSPDDVGKTFSIWRPSNTFLAPFLKRKSWEK